MISGLSTTDVNFPLQLWDKITEQALITLNMVRTSILEVRTKLSVIITCSVILSHNCNGKLTSVVLRPLIMWFLNVCITRSAVFAR